MSARLLRRVQAAATEQLLHLDRELERQAPRRGLRHSMVPPSPEKLPAVLSRIENGWRQRGEPEFGYRRHAA